jgi:hypothetical protein
VVNGMRGGDEREQTTAQRAGEVETEGGAIERLKRLVLIGGSVLLLLVIAAQSCGCSGGSTNGFTHAPQIQMLGRYPHLAGQPGQVGAQMGAQGGAQGGAYQHGGR